MESIAFWFIFVLASPGAPDFEYIDQNWCKPFHEDAKLTAQASFLPWVEGTQMPVTFYICWPPKED